MFTWTPSTNQSLYTSDPAYYLQFEATDSMGASALFWPTIKLCPCDSPLQCDWDFMDNDETAPSPSELPLWICVYSLIYKLYMLLIIWSDGENAQPHHPPFAYKLFTQ